MVRWIFEWLWRFARFRRWMSLGFLGLGRDRGSARRLVGDVPFVLFEATPGGSVRPAPRALSEALTFLRKEALRYGHGLRFHPLTDRPLPLTYPGRRPRGRRLQSLVATRIRRMRWLTGRAAFALILVDVPGEAWAVPEWHRPLGCVEYCVCSRSSSAGILAHEILHLFGAMDLYVPKRGNFPEWAHRRFVDELGCVTDSIMRDARSLQIDPATAFAVGWADVLDSRP
jgi:hypothetical protein